jgi:TonB-linked SusC/RagA family outer membrane protein
LQRDARVFCLISSLETQQKQVKGMKKNFYHFFNFYTLMKITLSQLLLVSLFSGISFAEPGFAQDVLNTRVSLALRAASLGQALEQLENKTGARFAYSQEFIQMNAPVSLDVRKERLSLVLSRLLEPLQIAYEVSGNQIVLKRASGHVRQRESYDLGEQTEGDGITTPAEETLSPNKRSAFSVNGRVTNDAGEGIPGVSVVLKGTTLGTATDTDGKYTLSLPDEQSNGTLVFSFIGYIAEEVAIGNRTTIDVSLVPDIQALSEVVVVGYGSQQKATVTGSVAQISGQEITKSPTPNVTSSLAGRLPGLIVSQRSGEPGRDDPNLLIRGNGTFGDNSPLIIIDGVQRSLMSRLNPQDIESISVLKDASAAIYGARAANGVILITTKKGVRGKPTFDFSYNYAFQSPTKIPDVLDAATFAQVFNEGDWYRKGRPATYTPFYSDAAIQHYRNGTDPILYPNTNWVREVLKPYSFQQRINLQVSGGSENTRYLLSFGTTDQDGNLRNNPTRYKQYNLRAKIDVDLTKNLSVGANIYAIINDRNYSSIGTDVNFVNILQANPTIVARYPNGLIGPGRLGENPLLLDQRGLNTIEDTPLYSTFTATYKIPGVNGLQLDASFNYDLSNQFEKTFNIPYFYHEYNVNTQQYDRKQGTGTATPELWNYYRKWTTMMHNFRLTYDNTFNQHHVAAMVGTEQQKNTFKEAMAYRKNFVSTTIDQINIGSNAPADKNNGGTASASAYNNFFGRLNYDFNAKYLLEMVFRYDGSQIFPQGKRYGFFPGFSAGWRLSEEKFIQNSLPFVSQLKLRVSHGQIGNDRVGQYQYLQAFSFGDNYVFGGNDVTGIFPNTMPNPNITWEVSKKTDVGLEATLWKGLLGFELTLWNQRRSNILASRNLSVSNVFGFSGLPNENIGKVNSNGYELLISHKNSVGGLVYSVSGNVAYANSQIIYMDEAPQPEPYQNQTGHPVGSALYYKADGIFNTQDELNSYPHGAGAQVGDIRVLDLNGDGIIDSKDQFRFDYSVVPQYTFGLNADFQYRNFDLNLFFQGQTKAYNYDGTAAALGGSDFSNAVVYRATDRWTIDNPNGSMPRADAWQPGNTTFFLYDATFIRLKTVELGYTLPKSMTSRIKLNTMRIYVSAFNALTWAKVIKWADPEINGNFTAYPPQRVINLGVNLNF